MGMGRPTLCFVFIMLPVIVLNHLYNQICFLIDELFFSSYKKISINRPIFIVGPPRCGTSMFLELLNKSEDITSTKAWELHFAPSICQKLFYRKIGKIDRLFGNPLKKKYFKVRYKIFSEFDKIHKSSLFHYEEDAMLFYHSASTPFFLFFFPFLELKTPFTDFDQSVTPEYKTRYMKFYKECIQKHLFVHGKDKTYLSKNPLFSYYILTLQKHFPDARFIFMTRTPYNVVPSTFSLMTYFKGHSYYIDKDFLKTALMEIIQKQYTYPFEVLDFENKQRHIMIQYHDLMGNPKAVVEKILDRFGISCSEELKQALSERQSGAKKYVSRNTYSLAKYNISESQFKAIFKDILTTYEYEEEDNINYAAQY
jgi:hypothetical protein